MKDKLLTILFYPFVFTMVWGVALKSIVKHMRFFAENHPTMTAEIRHERIVENVVNDLKKFKRDCGIVDRSTT